MHLTDEKLDTVQVPRGQLERLRDALHKLNYLPSFHGCDDEEAYMHAVIEAAGTLLTEADKP